MTLIVKTLFIFILGTYLLFLYARWHIFLFEVSFLCICDLMIPWRCKSTVAVNQAYVGL